MPGRDNARPRIALFLPSMVAGGAERGAIFVGRILDRGGYEVEFVVAQAKGRLLEDPFVRPRLVTLGDRDPVFSLPAYLAYLRRSRPNLVISFIHGANFISGLATLGKSSPPLIVSIRNTLIKDPQDQWWLRRAFGLGIERRLYANARYVHVVSQELADQCRDLLGIPAARIWNTLNTAESFEDIDRRFHVPAASPEALSHAPYLASAGRLAAIKGFDSVIRAYARSSARKTHRLMLIGEGPERERLEAEIAKLGLQDRVVMAGYRDPLLPWLVGASGFIYASRGEGLSRVVHEALLCGLPVAAYACPGVNELLGYGEVGTLVPIGDEAGLAGAVDAIASGRTQPEPETRAAHLEKFSAAAVAERYLEMVRAALAGGQAPAPFEAIAATSAR